MEWIISYMAGMILVAGMFAWRVPNENCRIVFLLSLIWPLSFVLTAFMIVLTIINWKLEVVDSTKLFGFRKSTNPAVRGYAVTIFGNEIQLFKVIK